MIKECSTANRRNSREHAIDICLQARCVEIINKSGALSMTESVPLTLGEDISFSVDASLWHREDIRNLLPREVEVTIEKSLSAVYCYVFIPKPEKLSYRVIGVLLVGVGIIGLLALYHGVVRWITIWIMAWFIQFRLNL